MKKRLWLLPVLCMGLLLVSCHSKEYNETKKLLKEADGNSDEILMLFEETLDAGSEECLGLFLKDSRIYMTVDSTGCTFLMSAVLYGDVKTAEKLIDLGVPVNAVDEYGDSALIYLPDDYDSNTKEIYRTLVEKGIDINFRDDDGNLLSYCALRRGNYALAAFLVEDGAQYTKDFLFMAAKNKKHNVEGNINLFKVLLENGLDPNTFVFDEDDVACPLVSEVLAANINDREITSMLYEYGADFNYGGTNSPWSCAKYWDSDDIKQILTDCESGEYKYIEEAVYTTPEEQRRKEFLSYVSEYGYCDVVDAAIMVNGKLRHNDYEIYHLETYDYDGNRIYSDGDGGSCWYEYDSEGREIRYRENDYIDWRFEYETEDGVETQYVCDSDGDRSVYAEREYDDEGRLVKETEYTGYETEYRYDDEGRLSKRVRDGNVTVCKYDTNGFLVRDIYEGSSITDYVNDRYGNPVDENSYYYDSWYDEYITTEHYLYENIYKYGKLLERRTFALKKYY